jgi:mRNA-degrading endonuclease HigB of HigAB toxin-antitoxin module
MPDLTIKKKLIKYQNLVENDKWDTPEAIKLRKELDAWAGNQEATLKRIDINIRMREYKRGSK